VVTPGWCWQWRRIVPAPRKTDAGQDAGAQTGRVRPPGRGTESGAWVNRTSESTIATAARRKPGSWYANRPGGRGLSFPSRPRLGEECQADPQKHVFHG